jgi:hypothetical protein
MVVLINACKWDVATLFGNYYTKEILVNFLKNNNIEYILLDGVEANRENWEDALKNKGIDHTTGCGHGNEYIFSGQNAEALFHKFENIDLGKDKTHAWLSCLCGKPEGILDQMVKEHGAKATQGYSREFGFVVSRETPPDDIAEVFFDSHYAFDISYFTHKNWTKAHEDQLMKFDYYLAQDLPDVVKQWLLWDKNGSVIYLPEEEKPAKYKIKLEGYVFSKKIPIYLEGTITES